MRKFAHPLRHTLYAYHVYLQWVYALRVARKGAGVTAIAAPTTAVAVIFLLQDKFLLLQHLMCPVTFVASRASGLYIRAQRQLWFYTVVVMQR